MATDLDALYQAILANPADRTVRLVYADALDERCGEGDAALAQYIRACVAQEQYPPESDEYRAANAQVTALHYAVNAARPPVLLPSGERARYMHECGFVGLLMLDLNERQYIAEMCRRYPIENILFLHEDREQHVDGAALTDAISSLPPTIRELNLGNNELWLPGGGPETIPNIGIVISKLQEKPGIQRLNLFHNGLGMLGDCSEWLGRLANIPHLTELNLAYNALGSFGEGEQNMSQLCRMRQLRMLDIRNNSFGQGANGERQWNMLARASLPNLESLDLRGNQDPEAFVINLKNTYFDAIAHPAILPMINLKRLNGWPLPPDLEKLRQRAYDARAQYELEYPGHRVLPQEVLENARRKQQS